MRYRKVVVTARGGPENLRVVEEELRPPRVREVRVRVLAAPVSAPDVQSRYGRSPFPPKTPFVPGYAVVGVVDAVGEGAESTAVGHRVAALTTYGGYAEYITLGEKVLIPVPAGLDPAESATLILNHLVAYQVMHRSAKVRPGDKVMIIGASGGIGTALLQLGRLAGLTMYGVASAGKQGVLSEYGATPIDYRSEDFVEVIRRAEPEGLDAVFDGMSGDNYRRGFACLRRGGTLVGYGNPRSVGGTLRVLFDMIVLGLVPNGRSAKLYGTGKSYLDRKPFLEDWETLFRLLGEGRIRPVIARTNPILEAAQANAFLESGEVIGNVVLVAPEEPRG